MVGKVVDDENSTGEEKRGLGGTSKDFEAQTAVPKLSAPKRRQADYRRTPPAQTLLLRFEQSP